MIVNIYSIWIGSRGIYSTVILSGGQGGGGDCTGQRVQSSGSRGTTLLGGKGGADRSAVWYNKVGEGHATILLVCTYS